MPASTPQNQFLDSRTIAHAILSPWASEPGGSLELVGVECLGTGKAWGKTNHHGRLNAVPDTSYRQGKSERRLNRKQRLRAPMPVIPLFLASETSFWTSQRSEMVKWKQFAGALPVHQNLLGWVYTRLTKTLLSWVQYAEFLFGGNILRV